jgi:hypothetical protein
MTRQAEDLPVLVAQRGPLSGQRWIIKDTLVVGREPVCDIPIPDRKVSRQHATFTSSTKGVTLADLDSKNGTHHNGKRLRGEVRLEDGDIIQIALAQQFMFISSDATLPLDIDTDYELLEEGKGRLRIEKRSRRVWIGEKEVLPPLSVAQFRLLELLYEKRGRVVSREELAIAIWGEEEAYGVSNQAMDALIRRLRDRLGAIEKEHNFIITVRGHGLRLENS